MTKKVVKQAQVGIVLALVGVIAVAVVIGFLLLERNVTRPGAVVLEKASNQTKVIEQTNIREDFAEDALSPEGLGVTQTGTGGSSASIPAAALGTSLQSLLDENDTLLKELNENQDFSGSELGL